MPNSAPPFLVLTVALAGAVFLSNSGSFSILPSLSSGMTITWKLNDSSKQFNTLANRHSCKIRIKVLKTLAKDQHLYKLTCTRQAGRSYMRFTIKFNILNSNQRIESLISFPADYIQKKQLKLIDHDRPVNGKQSSQLSVWWDIRMLPFLFAV